MPARPAVPGAVLILSAFALAWAAPGAANGVGGVSIEHQTVVTLSIRPLPPAVRAVPTGRVAAEDLRLTLAPDAVAEGELDVELDGRVFRVRLRATRVPPTPAAPARVVLRAESTAPGGSRRISERTIGIDRRETALFEIRREGDLPLTLGIAASAESEAFVRTAPRVGRPLAFEVELLRLHDDRETRLESSFLQTFEHQSVSYRFRTGSGPAVESMDVRLTPLGIEGDIVDIAVDVTAMVPDGDGGSVAVARRERWVATRGAGSSVSIVGGDPPRGYRLLVTPRF